MTWKAYMASYVAISFLFGYSTAYNNEWYDDATKLGVKNGVPYSKDADVERFIEAPLAVEIKGDDYLQNDNVIRVKRLFTEDQFEFMFPLRDSLYTYDGFLKAVGTYPHFCDDKGPYLEKYTEDQACQRELSMLFTHINQESGKPNTDIPFWRHGLAATTELHCTPYQDDGLCEYKTGASSWATAAFPPQENEHYFGRGPLQLSWNYNFGYFSKVLNVQNTYDDHMYLLENPDKVFADSFTVFKAAFWFYMTPQSPKPSIHDVASGNYVPTTVDKKAGFTNGLGVTTDIINGGKECGSGSENAASQNRINTYVELLKYFGLQEETTASMGCKNLSSAFPKDVSAYGVAYSYFEYADWFKGGDACRVVYWQTPYHVAIKDDYKRCVCATLGSSDPDCPQ